MGKPNRLREEISNPHRATYFNNRARQGIRPVQQSPLALAGGLRRSQFPDARLFGFQHLDDIDDNERDVILLGHGRRLPTGYLGEKLSQKIHGRS
jgi:hypothetical protein